jgi:hypothetical protein
VGRPGGQGKASADGLDITVVARGHYCGSHGRIDSTAAIGGCDEAYVDQVNQ